MKGDFHVRFCEKFEVKLLLLTRLRGWRLITASYSIISSFPDEPFGCIAPSVSPGRADRKQCE